MPRTKSKLAVVYLEDNERDAELIYQTLIDALDYDIAFDRAANKAEYHSLLASKQYDVILADYTLPGYNAREALKKALSFCPDVPFICVSGTIGEDVAVELLKQGASDYVLKDRMGRLPFAIQRAIDEIEEKKELRRAIRLSEEKYRMMCDSSNEGIAMYDRNGIVLNANAQFENRYGKTKAELIGKSIMELLPEELYGDLCAQRLRRIEEVFRTGEAVVFEDSRDGASFLNRYYPSFDEGKIEAVTLFSTDISSSKKAIEEEQKNKYLTEFFTNITHDLKTPLSVILIQLEVMKFCVDNQPKLNEMIDSTRRHAYRLSRLIGNLLDLTRLDAGCIEPRYVKRDIVALLKELCDSVEAYAKNRALRLDYVSDLPAKIMPLDSELLERVVLNLLSNAIKFTDENGLIQLEVRDRDDGGAIVSVRDTGKGLTQEEKELLFTRFSRIDQYKSKKNEGSGIGLPLTKSLVELMGGCIRVQSEIGVGSEFIIELPLIQAEPQEKRIDMEGYKLCTKVAMELSDIHE